MGRYVKRNEQVRHAHEPRANGPRGHESRRSSAEDAPASLIDQLAQVAQQHISERARKPVTDASKLARALRLSSEQLEGNIAAPLLETAADGLDHAVELFDRDARELVDAMERFARAQPAVFYGGALALGLGAGRFLKSSARGAAARKNPEPTAARTARHGHSQPPQDEGTRHEPESTKA
jgi:hypothetical protein